MAAKRLTRKEMVRQDRIQQTLRETSGFLFRNLKYIFSAIAILLVVVATSYLWRTYRSSAQMDLQGKFSDALAKYHASVTDPAADKLPDPAEPQAAPLPSAKYEYATTQERAENARTAFQELSEAYSGMRLGVLSRFYVGLTLIDLNRFDEAKTTLRSVSDDSEFPDISNLARNSLVQMAIGAGDHQEAIRLLRQILDNPSRNFPQQVVLMRLAQSYEAVGDYQSALRNYKRISAEYAGSAPATMSQSKIDYFKLRGVTLDEEETEEEEPPPDAEE